MNEQEYLKSNDPKRFLDGCPCGRCTTFRDEFNRAKADRERGIYPVVISPGTLGYCDRFPRTEHCESPVCKGWNPVSCLGTCPFVDGLHTRCGTAWKVHIAPPPVSDQQKNLRDFRESMGNPLPKNPAPSLCSDNYLTPLTESAGADMVDALKYSTLRDGWTPYKFSIGVAPTISAEIREKFKKLASEISPEMGHCDNGPVEHEKGPGCKNWKPSPKTKTAYATRIDDRMWFGIDWDKMYGEPKLAPKDQISATAATMGIITADAKTENVLEERFAPARIAIKVLRARDLVAEIAKKYPDVHLHRRVPGVSAWKDLVHRSRALVTAWAWEITRPIDMGYDLPLAYRILNLNERMNRQEPGAYIKSYTKPGAFRPAWRDWEEIVAAAEISAEKWIQNVAPPPVPSELSWL